MRKRRGRRTTTRKRMRTTGEEGEPKGGEILGKETCLINALCLMQR